MIKSILTFSLIFAIFQGFSAEVRNNQQFMPISENYLNKVVGAIFIAEGGNNTKWPYGIKSIKTNNPKRICENTVRNHYIRWQQWGKTNSFLISLADRYCPQSVDRQGNTNWKKNIQKLVDK